MSKKKIRIVFTFVFIISLLFPIFTMPFWSEDSSAEKRELSEKPVLYSQETGFNSSYSSEMSNYVSEHFSFRSHFVSAWSVFLAKVFHTSTRDNVVVGKDNWLFFADTLPDYFRTNVFSERQICDAVKTLDMINEYVESQGGRFLFIVAPNKNTVYPQYMPAFQKPGTSASNYELLTEALSGKEYFLNILPMFQAYDRQLYHKRDSHWNNLGAQICFSEAVKKLGMQCEDYEKNGYSIEKTWSGDLDQMLFPTLDIRDEQVVYNKDFDYEYVSSFRSVDDLKITTFNSGGSGNLVMYRDSFTNALQPFFSDLFKNAYFTRILPCRLVESEIGSGDVVILELAERNLNELLSSAPVMTAPERKVTNVFAVGDAQFFLKNTMNMTHVFGYTGDTSDIYIEVTQNGKKKFYETFPIMEEELLSEHGAQNVSNGGFGVSAYLPYDNLDEASIKVVKTGE